MLEAARHHGRPLAWCAAGAGVLAGLVWLYPCAAYAERPYPPFLIESEPSVFQLTRPAPKGVTTGSISLGGVHTSGSSHSSSINGKLELKYTRGRWHDHLNASALYGKQGGHTTARRFAGANLIRYYLSPRQFLFGNLSGLKDRFAGYDYQFSETAGYGWIVLKQKHQGLDLELGAGLAQTHEVGSAQHDTGVLRFAAQYDYRLSKHSQFTQTVEILADPHNTYSQAVTAIDVSVYRNIGLQLSYTITHNSQTPAGISKTTAITSVNLLYGF